MILLLGLASLYIACKVAAEVGHEATKMPTRSKIMRDSKNGTFNVVNNFEDILYNCDVKKKKHNSLLQYCITQDTLNAFIT